MGRQFVRWSAGGRNLREVWMLPRLFCTDPSHWIVQEQIREEPVTLRGQMLELLAQ